MRLLVADDHPVIRDGLSAVFQSVPGFEVIGTAGLAATTLRMVAALQPHVLLLDLGLPDSSGVTVAQTVRERWPNVAVVVLTGYSVRSHSRLLTQLGVRGIVHKTAHTDQLVKSVMAAAEGRNVPDAGRTEHQPSPSTDPLTMRELEVLALVAGGMRNAEIAEQLHVSVNTVEFHMRNLLGKLGARSRTEAVSRARAAGYSLSNEAPTFD